MKVLLLDLKIRVGEVEVYAACRFRYTGAQVEFE
jgi:hypothetical protein